MGTNTSTTLASSGIARLTALDPHAAGPDGWMFRFTPSAFGGQIVLYADQNAPGSIVTRTTSNLTAVPWTTYSTLVAVTALTPLVWTSESTTSRTIVVTTAAIFPLYANVTWYTGALQVYVAPYTARDTKAETALFSGLTFDSVPVAMDDTWELVPAVETAADS